MVDSATALEQGTSPWDRLRRRKVVQWGLLYAAGAWGFLQGLEYVAESFHWPDQIRQVSILALLIGLPIVLVIAWYHGDRGARRVSGTELAIVTLLFLLGGGLFWWYDQAGRDGFAPAVEETEVVRAEPASADSRPSIAVLPFENRSRLEDDAFFVDGIHDDILTQLSKVSALRVISRTSVERFRETEMGVREIAQQLGVRSILEGGVQRAGDRVRVNVQLIDAGTDAHLWAEHYDRELTAANIFAIQSEVATAIAGALRATLTAGEKTRVVAVPTQNIDAWEAYQLAKQHMVHRRSDSLADAERLFRKAIAIDSRFALAYASLADTLRLQTDYSGKPLEAAMEEADRLTSKALEIEPDLAEAWTAKGGSAMSRGDYETAERLLLRAVALNPNDAQSRHWLSMVLRVRGQQAAGLEHATRAVQLDPLSGIVNLNLGEALEVMGRYEEAAARYRQVIDFAPQSAMAHHSLAITNAYALSRLAAGASLQERAVALDPGNPMTSAYLCSILLDLGDEARARQVAASMLERWPDGYYSNVVGALLHQAQGKPDAATRHAVKALTEFPKDPYSLRVLRDNDLRQGHFQSARARYAAAYPELLTSPRPPIDALSLASAIDLALVLQATGERSQAIELLVGAEKVLRTLSRLGTSGYGLADVQIHALRGDATNSLAALREAEQAGWRGPLWRYHRDLDPSLASIRNEREFKAVFADIERDIVRQRAELTARPKKAPLDLQATGT